MKLPRAIKDKSGKTLRTTEEAKRYVLGKLKTRPALSSRGSVRRNCSIEKGSPEQIATQIELALLLDGQLDAKFAQEQTA